MNTRITQISNFDQKQTAAGSTKASDPKRSKEAVSDNTKSQPAELTISSEAEERQKKQQERALKEEYQDQAESAQEAGKAFADQAKLMEIARRISRGDKVPFKDEKKLIEFNPKLYQAAKSAAMLHMHEKHKKYKSLFEDEDEKSMRDKLRELDQEEDRSEKVDAGEADSREEAGTSAPSDTAAATDTNME